VRGYVVQDYAVRSGSDVARASCPCNETVNPNEFGLAQAIRRSMEATKVRQGAYLPHWTRQGAIYATTFRLIDSVPQSILRAWEFERDDIVRTARQLGRELTSSEQRRLEQLFAEKIDRYLDAGRGECWVYRDDVAASVSGALGFFEGVRYKLLAWCVMPNHVHAVLEPVGEHTLPEILHSWKSFTANKCNKELGRTGAFWHPEYYDHLVRDDADLHRQVEYVLSNPGRAGLTGWKWVSRGIASAK
jgi:REP element-mobilizing transposase RayT